MVGVLSVIPIIGVVLATAKAQQGSPGQVSREVDLPRLLRDIAERHGVRRGQIRAALTGWDVDGFLDGTRPLQWDFVKAFLAVIAAGDRNVRKALEHLVRSAWDAVRGQPGGEVSGSAVVLVTPVTDRWLTTNEMAAAASQTLVRLQQSAGQLESWRETLVFALGKYSESIRALAAERAQLVEELSALRDRARRRESRLSAQVSQKDSELHDVKQRLERAEKLRERTRERLVQTERKLDDARKARDDAAAQAALYRQRLAGFERRPVLAAQISPGPDAPDTYHPMGATDQELAEKILDSSGEFLRVQEATINQGKAAIRHRRENDPARQSAEATLAEDRHTHRRVILPVAGVTAVAAGLVTLAFSFSGHPVGHVPGPSPTSRPKTTGLRSPVVTTLLTVNGYIPESVAFSPGRKTVAVATTVTQSGNGATYLWNLADPRANPVKLADPGGTGVQAVAFSPAGTRLASGDANGTTYLWNPADPGAKPTPLADPGGTGVQAVAFGPAGTRLASGGANGTTYLWNLTIPAPSRPRWPTPAERVSRRSLSALMAPRLPSATLITAPTCGTTLITAPTCGTWPPMPARSGSTCRKKHMACVR